MHDREPPLLKPKWYVQVPWLVLDALAAGKVMAAIVGPIGEVSPVLAIFVGIPLGIFAGGMVAVLLHLALTKSWALLHRFAKETRVLLAASKQRI